MKVKILVSGLLLASSIGLFAQPALRIQQNAAPTIRMTAGSAPSANWQIGAGAVTTGATLVHTWSEAPGNYTLNVTPLSTAGCSGETKAYTIEVFSSLSPTEPNITAITGIGTACPVTSSNPTSTANVNITVANIPATSAYKVWYSVAGTDVTTPANVAAGATSFSIDASSVAAGGTATVIITKFQVGTDPQVVLASGPSGTLNVSSVPVVNGIE